MAARRPPLRAVKPGEVSSTKPRVLSMEKAAAEGTYLELLMAMKVQIAKDIVNPKTNAVARAALQRRLHEVARDVEAISAIDEGDDIGDAAATPDGPLDQDAL